MPFPIRGFDCDNGSEFLNDHLVRYFKNKRIPLTRSRPYRKNDNVHVEQKNWIHARILFGYGKIENPDLVPVMNDIFKNFLIPGMKLMQKIRRFKRYLDLNWPQQLRITLLWVAAISQPMTTAHHHTSANSYHKIYFSGQSRLKNLHRQLLSSLHRN
jgi:hypothetical protein